MNNRHEHVDADLVNEDRSIENCSMKRRKISDSLLNSSEHKKEPNSLISTNSSRSFSLRGLDKAQASLGSADTANHDASANNGKECFPECSKIGCSGLEQENVGRKSKMEIEDIKFTSNKEGSANLFVTNSLGENCEQAGEAKPSINLSAVSHIYTAEETTKQTRCSSGEEKASDYPSMMRHPIDNLGHNVESKMADTSLALSELDAIKENMTPLGNKEARPPPILSSCTGTSQSLSKLDAYVAPVGNEEDQTPQILSSCKDTSSSLSELDVKENVQVGNVEDQLPQVLSSSRDRSQSLSQLDTLEVCIAPVGNKENQHLEILNSCADTNSSLSELDALKGNYPPVGNEKDQPPHILRSKESTPYRSKKKLLVLDVNGIIADIVADPHEAYRPDTIIGSKAVFKRPYCDEFLKFCFEKFNVGVWTSRTRRNIERALDFLMRDSQQNLLFCWDQSHCTDTGFKTLENRDKPLLLKELQRLWEKQDPNLPWDRGDYDETNTLLLDDSPYKALCNPPHTAIFPYSYRYRNTRDNLLGPRGEFRDYLERLAAADNVQKFVEQNPFGQRPITEKNLSWKFYLRVISATSSQLEADATSSSPAKPLAEVDNDYSSKPVSDESSEK